MADAPAKHDPANSSSYRRACRNLHAVLTGVVLLIAGSNLLVWIAGFGNSPHVTVMRFNAALAMTACGISLWLSRDENGSRLRRGVASALGLFTSLLGGLTALQYFTGWDLGIDEFFKTQRQDVAGTFTTHPGRTSLNAALTLTGAGLSLALLDVRWRRRSGGSLSFAPGLAILSAVPIVAAFVGYAIGLGYLTGVLGSTNMLLHTAVAQLALCAAILTARPDRQPMRLILSPGPAGMLLRWLGPATIALLLGLGWVVHLGQRAQVYGANDALALMILLGLLLLGALLFATATAVGRTEERRARAAAAVREQEERFRMLADNISQLAWMTDASGSISWYNKRWYEYTGTTPEQVAGWGWKIVHDPAHVERVVDGFARAVAAGTQWEDTFPIRSRSGEWRWFLSRALPMRDDADRVVGWFGTNTDITEQRAAADALSAAKEVAEGANRAKDAFLAALSHELRTPLTPVLMTAEELCDDPALPGEVRDQLCMVRRNIRLEARLIDDLLDLTRATQGKFALRHAACDLKTAGREALEMVREEAAGRSLTLTEELDHSPAWLQADCTRVEQVLWNLLRNSVKFTPSGGRVTLRTKVDHAANRWIAEVEDTGIGIAADVLPRLFKPFEQGGLMNDHRFGGLGLGLAISKTIVELHGGTIEARSEGVNRGATFRVSLGPLLSRPAEVAPAADCAPASTKAPGPLRLLLVEDHAPTRAVLSRLLRRGGHTVTEAADVSSALAAAAEANGQFDALVSDIGLPDGSGQDLMAELRKSYGLRGIAVSGYGTEEDLRRSSDSGFAAHLTKPVEFAQLREALSRFTSAD